MQLSAKEIASLLRSLSRTANEPHFTSAIIAAAGRGTRMQDPDGNTKQMIFNCARIISYASKYIKLMPGDLIFTGTPSGAALEDKSGSSWIGAGDHVDVVIEGIGTLSNTMV